MIATITETVRKKLEGKNFVYLATLFPDGSPQVTPVWVDTDGEFILVNTAIGRSKHLNIKRDPRVAIALSDPANPYDFLQIRGKVVDQITGPSAEDHIDKMAKKYYGKERNWNKRLGESRVILRILPERVTG